MRAALRKSYLLRGPTTTSSSSTPLLRKKHIIQQVTTIDHISSVHTMMEVDQQVLHQNLDKLKGIYSHFSSHHSYSRGG